MPIAAAPFASRRFAQHRQCGEVADALIAFSSQGVKLCREAKAFLAAADRVGQETSGPARL